jgi:dihydrofolate synthase/folylpolyglutamate synthase
MEDAVAFIHSLSQMSQKRGLHNMELLLERLSHPEKQLYMVHVAGTNGKGSTCAMIESVLRAAGLRTGLYTSPFLQRYNERIRLNGQPIPDADLAELVEKTRPLILSLREQGVYVTEFEYGTALAYLYFAGRTDVCVIEVGLGGRLDPTNAAEEKLSVITPIGLDHMHILGDTIEKIAAEKAGIIKPGVPVILAPMDAAARRVIMARAQELGCDCTALRGTEAQLRVEGERVQVFDYTLDHLNLRHIELGLNGAHQVQNAATALTAIRRLRRVFDIPEAAIREGLCSVRWPGRLEWMGNVLLDGAHNPHGARTLAEYAGKWLEKDRTVLLIAAMRDKDVVGVLRLLRPLCGQVVCTRVPDWPRAMEENDLCALAGEGAQAIGDMRRALETARSIAGAEGTVICAGSLYLVGAVRTMLEEEGYGV